MEKFEKAPLYGLISRHEMDLCIEKIGKLLRFGATQARVSLTRSIQNCVNTLDGEIDSIGRDDDCSYVFDIFLDGRYCTVSSNTDEGDDFLRRAVEAASLLSPDPGYRLPDKTRKAENCLDGRELELYDPDIPAMEGANDLDIAAKASVWGRSELPSSTTLISEEGEFCRYSSDIFIADSDGFQGRRLGSCISYSADVTLEDGKGEKYSDRWWDTAVRLSDFDCGSTGERAVANAARKMGPVKPASGKYGIVVDTTVASHLVSPLLEALDAYNLHYGKSFLQGCDGRKLFADKFSIVDLPHEKGKYGSALFDLEGVATFNLPLVQNGVISNWYMDNFACLHSDFRPTFNKRCHPTVLPFTEGHGPGGSVGVDTLMGLLGKGLYITDFMGGNCNPVTGDFSYGVSGLAFDREGFTKPFSEVLISGNFKDLFAGIIAAGNDQRPCMRYNIPSLAFPDVAVNA